MKKLQKEFTGNYDKVGMNKFVQIRKENGVAIYQRFNTDGTPRSYEVFIIKTVPKGAPLPNGKLVEESYEQYPGANAFGKTAYDCRTLANAEERFDQLVIKAKDSEALVEDQLESLGRTTNLGGLGGGGVHIRISGDVVHYVSNLPEFVEKTSFFFNFFWIKPRCIRC